MTEPCSGEALASAIASWAPGAVAMHSGDAVWIKPERWLEVARGMRDRPDLAFDYLNLVTAVDYIGYFEVVYHLTSIARNRSAVVKIRCGEGRTDPAVDSVYSVWRGSDLQEREAWDLMGIRFPGHPNLKRLLLWDGFPGHPLRKDFLR